MKTILNKYKDYRIHTSIIEETIKEKERKKRFLRGDIMQEGKRKERPLADNASRYEIKYLLGPNLSIVVKRLLPLEDLGKLYATDVDRISQIQMYGQLIRSGAGFDIQDDRIVAQYFKDSLTILYNADKLDMIANFEFYYDNSARVAYSRNINLSRVEFKPSDPKERIGQYNPVYILNLFIELLQKEKRARNYYRWRKGLGFGFNKQTI
jgi:hypothetical protein